ncbi:MAG: TolC family protein, partial [Candidatus Acidiferrum sp.]
NPQVQHLQQEKQIEASRRSLLRWERLPNLDVQVGTDLNAPRDFHVGPRGQIAVTVPLFSRNQGEIAQSSAQLHFLDLSLASAKLAAQTLVESAYYDYQSKQMQVELYNKNLVPATIKLEAMAEDSYKEGRANILVVVDAQRKVAEIRRAYLDSLFALQSSFAALEELVGAPLD